MTATSVYNGSTHEWTESTDQSWTTTDSALTTVEQEQSTEAKAMGTVSGNAMEMTTQATTTGDPGLNANAIIAGAVFGLLLIGVIVAGVCLTRARRRRVDGQRDGGGGGGGCSSSQRVKTPRPTPAGASAPGREPNPYTNSCFDASKEEMGEKVHHTEEPARSATEAINSVRNKEDHWIIPLEELAEDDTASNFDTTRF